MDHSMENIGSHSSGNQQNLSSPMQLNEDIELRITQNAATTSSRNSWNGDDNAFRVNNRSVVDQPSFLTCENLLGNFEGMPQSHARGLAENDNNIISGASQPNNLCYPQMPGGLFNTEGNVAAVVQRQSVGGGPVFTSPFHDFSISSEDFMDFSSLFDNVQRPHVDINTIMNEVNAEEVLRPSLGGATGLYNNFQSPQIGRGSINIGSNRPHIMQQQSRAGAVSHASNVQSARSNSDIFMPVVTQSNHLRIPQVNRSSVRIGGKNASAIQRSYQGETGTGKSQGVTVDGHNDTSIPIPSNNSQGQQISRSLTSSEGGFTSTMSVDSLGETRHATNLGSNECLFNRHQSFLTDRNFINVEDDSHDVQKSQVGGRLMALNNVKTNEKQSVSALCSEEFDNSLLNLGLGDSTPFGFQCKSLGGGFSSDNGFSGTMQSDAIHGSRNDGNFLSLGGNLGNRNNGATAGVTSKPYLSLGGNMENQTSFNNASRRISGTNAGVNLNPMTTPQAVRGNMNQHVSRPTGRTSVPQGNGAARFVTIPYRGHGHASVGMSPVNNIPSGLHANELAMLYRLPLRPSPRMAVPTGIRSANLQQAYTNTANLQQAYMNTANLQQAYTNTANLQQAYMNSANLQQAYMNNIISTNSSMASPLISSAARAFRQDHSGHPIPFKNMFEAANGIPALSDNRTQMQADQHTSSKSRRGKRVSTDGIQRAQPAKVRLGTSVGGKPVPVPGGVGGAQTYEGVLGQSIWSNHTQNVPAITRAPRGRKALQPSINPSTASGNQTKIVYHLKFEDPTVYFASSEEKCHICKRDLTFTPKGPVTQPPIPPAVAVLYCGHTFHDECLQRITPEDQLKDPPCIPCAIGSS